jgi:hypothetical protein
VLPSHEKIVVRARLNRGVWELLVKWTGQSDADTTWEQLEDFKQQFPRVELTNELFVSEGEMLWTLSWASNIGGVHESSKKKESAARVRK